MAREQQKLLPVNERAVTVWRYAFLLCFVVCVAAALLLPPDINAFRDRAIGIAVIAGSDIHWRVYLYVLLLAAATALFSFASLGTAPSRSAAGASAAAGDSALTPVLGTCLALNLAALLLDSRPQPFLTGAVIAAVLLAAWLALGRGASRSDAEAQFVRGVCVSWQAALTLFLLSGMELYPAFPLAATALLALVLVPGRVAGARGGVPGVVLPTVARFVGYAALLSPLLYVAANEITHLAPPGSLLSAAGAPLFAALVAGAACIGLFAGRREGPGIWLCVLSVLVTTVLLNEYETRIVYRFYDLFHMGERILPLQQWERFGALPFIDYLPTHGLADVLPQFIYQVLGDRDYLEAMIWGNGHFQGWLMRSVAVVVLLRFIAFWLPLPGAFFLLWLLPTYHFIEPYYTLMLVPAIHLLAMPAYRSAHLWWAVQWLLVALLLLWRLDFGIGVFVGTALVAVLLAFHQARAAILARAAFWGAAVAGLVLALFWLLAQDGDPAAKLRLIGVYASNQIPVGSRAHFYESIDYAFVLQYVLLPLVCAAILARSLSALIRREHDAGQVAPDLAIVFLAAVSLILSVRSIQRHSLAEGDFNTYLHLLVLFLFVIRRLARSGAAMLLPALGILFMATYLVVPNAKDFLLSSIYHPRAGKEYPLPPGRDSLQYWENREPRLRNRETAYRDFVRFTQRLLQPGQTYYDFANSPLLYALADVRLPVYLIQTGYQASDRIQNAMVDRLAALHAQGELPFVLFRQGSVGYDQMDGVDSALRSYRIAEFLYANYTPCAQVSGLHIWLDRQLVAPGGCGAWLQHTHGLDARALPSLRPLAPGYLEQYVDFRLLPRVWARAEPAVDGDSARAETLSVHRTGPGAVSLAAAGQSSACGNGPCYLELTIRSERRQRIEAALFGRTLAGFDALPGEHTYRLRISVLWDWYRLGPARVIELGGTAPLQVVEAAYRSALGE